MVFWSKYYLDTRASAFEPAGNVYAPYYRQLDASFMINNFDGEAKELIKIPQGDVIAAFDYYIKHYNQGRPFVLVGHSQGSIMLTSVITDYLKENPEVYKRMVAAYLIGVPLTKQYYSAYPHMKAAQGADDVGVIVSYNVEAPVVDGKSAFSNPDSVLINPLSWKTDEELVPAADNIGSIVISFDDNNRYTFKKVKKLADAQINHNRGTIICTTVDAEKFSSALASRSYLPLGVLHENDIPLYYYSLRQNVKDRVKAYFNSLK
jgi:pimeloyl-ACP methyl ester carboxylesterase